MPARSKAQQMAAGAALSAKRGETPKSKLKGASKEMVDTMSEGELEAVASTKRKGLPGRKTAKKTAKGAPARKAAAPAKKRAAAKKRAK